LYTAQKSNSHCALMARYHYSAAKSMVCCTSIAVKANIARMFESSGLLMSSLPVITTVCMYVWEHL